MLRACSSLLALAILSPLVLAEDEVFSGPQPGEKITAFKVVGVYGDQTGKEYSLPQGNDKQTVLVFIHQWTRPLLQLIRPVDTFAAQWAKDGLNTQIVMLSADKAKAQAYLDRAKNSLKLKSPTSVSLDGLEGPGNYGLNRKMTVTILVAKGNKVTANFAIIQPNETDAPKVLAAMAKVIGKNPPTAKQIAAVGGRRRPVAGNKVNPELGGLMRQMINKNNDEATVKEVSAKMLKWAGDNPRKKTQLRQLCQRVIKAGYGTEYAQKALKRLAAIK